jgi:biotin operon repressor
MESEKLNKNGILKRYLRNSPIKWKMGFAMIPTAVLMDERLTRSSLVVFWALTVHLFRGKEYCFPSLTTLQKEAHSSRPTIIKAIKSLEEYGYLQVERTERKNNKYYLKVKV